MLVSCGERRFRVADQVKNAKVQSLLAALLEQYRLSATSRQAILPPQIVIQVRQGAQIEAICNDIQAHGGEIIALRQNEVEGRLPFESVEKLAQNEEVVSIRLARVHNIR